MKRFEEFVVTDWKEWDDLGDGYSFSGCTLNPEFFVGEEETLAEINEISAKYGVLPGVSFTFSDSGFFIEIWLWHENDTEEYVELGSWAFEGGITRGKPITKD